MNRTPWIPIASLIVANVLSLLATLYFDWDLFQVLLLFWAETGIIGLYSVVKLIKIGGILNVIRIALFATRFIVFTALYLYFIFVITNLDVSPVIPSWQDLMTAFRMIAWPGAGLFISHGISFFFNFLGNREYEKVTFGEQLRLPYQRIKAMSFTVAFGGVLIAFFGQPVIGLVFLVIIKTIMDIKAHLREHAHHVLPLSPPLPR